MDLCGISGGLWQPRKCAAQSPSREMATGGTADWQPCYHPCETTTMFTPRPHFHQWLCMAGHQRQPMSVGHGIPLMSTEHLWLWDSPINLAKTVLELFSSLRLSCLMLLSYTVVRSAAYHEGPPCIPHLPVTLNRIPPSESLVLLSPSWSLPLPGPKLTQRSTAECVNHLLRVKGSL